MRAQGLTGRAIAKELGLPSSNVFRILKGVCECRFPLEFWSHPHEFERSKKVAALSLGLGLLSEP